MIRRMAAIGLVIALMPLGCMLDESTHVIFLEPDGSVTWRVVQDLIRSDKNAVYARMAEEDEFLDEVEAAGDDLTDLFEEMGAGEVDSWFVRHRRPYTRIVTARFDGLDDATRGMIEHGAPDAEVELVHEDGLSRYTLRVEPGDPEAPGDDDAWEWAAHHVRVVLAEGRFVQARGFDLSEDGAIAVPRALTPEEREEHDGAHVYELVWDPRA